MNVTQDIGTKSSGSDRNPSKCSLSHCSWTCFLIDEFLCDSSVDSRRYRGAYGKMRCDIERDKLRVKKGHGWWKLGNMQTRMSLLEHVSYVNYCTTESLSRCIIIIAQNESFDWRVSLFSEYNFNKNFMGDKVLIILWNIFYDKHIQPSSGIYAIP